MKNDDLTPEQQRLADLARRHQAGESLTPVELADLYPQAAESIRIAFPKSFPQDE